MRLLFYGFMRHLCWLIEDIHNIFSNDISSFYPSMKWEILYDGEQVKRGKKWID